MNLSALRFPQFRRYMIASVFALQGLWVQRITTSWIAWEQTGSASFVGFIAFLTYMPTMITGPFFGVLVDRLNIRKAAMSAQASIFAVAILTYGLQVSGMLNAVILALIAVMVGIVTSAQHPIRMSFTPRLVPKGQVGSVITLIALNFNLARVLGPAIGGFLIARYGVETALLVTALAYLPAVVTIATLTPREIEKRGQSSSFLSDFAEGVRFILSTPLIIRAILISGLFSLSVRGTLEILPTIADGVFSRGAEGLGALTAGAGVGALAAALIQSLAKERQPGKLPLAALVAGLTGPLVITLLGTTDAWTVAIITVTAMGFLSTTVGVNLQTSIQLLLDDHMRGRVMSLWVMVSLGATALGALGIGALIDWFGLGLTLQCVGGACAVLILGLIRRR
ncbi:MAG: MFS transporter [Rhodobacteraceae bacterium]|nr:MFS transporter [Paracoccaceae bacterium]